MGRNPTGRPAGGADALSKRLRELRERSDLSAPDRARLERIIREVRDLDDITIDEILGRRDPDDRIPPGGKVGDFLGVPIKATQLSSLIGEMAAAVHDRTDPLGSVAAAVLDRLRAELPEALPRALVPRGRKGAALPVASAALAALVQLAAVQAAQGADSVVWDDGVNQLMVHASKIRAVVTEGMVRISIPVECDQLRATMEIPFAVGSEARKAGLILATAERPAGDALIARIWGDALIAFAYGALLDMAESLAGASGRDERNERLVPRGFIAKRGELIVESQARFVFRRGAP